MRHYISLFITLACLWLMLSGEYSFSHPLVAGMGVLSCLFVTWLSWRLDIHERVLTAQRISYMRLPAYAVWLIKEIITANWDVTKRIVASLCGKRDAIHPTMTQLNSTQSSHLTRVFYANSITLTPGTVAVYVKKQHITIHALSQESAADLARGDMDRRVTCLEVIK